MRDHRFPSADNAFSNLLVELLHDAPVVNSRIGKTRELVGVSLEIDPKQPYVTNSERKFSPIYGAGELMWYLSGSNRIEHIAHYAPSYKQFAKPDGTVFGAYGARWAETQQLNKLLNTFEGASDTRQAVLVQWMPRDLDAASGAALPEKDLPCTLTLQFLRRFDELHLIVTMRSNDAWLGMPNDWFCFMMLQHLIAGFLGCAVGKYVHQVGSLHLYEKDWAKAEQAAHLWGDGYADISFLDTARSPLEALNMISFACAAEADTRERGWHGHPPDFSRWPLVLTALVALCSKQTHPSHTALDGFIPQVLLDLVERRRS